MLPEFDTIVDQVEPPLDDLSIMYPVTTDPPLSLGAVQLRLTCDEDTAVAVSPVGGDGAAARVFPKVVLEVELVPTELMADTL